MTNRPKAKGTRLESLVRDYLKSLGFPAVERMSLNGAADRGDISGIPGWTIECKSYKNLADGIRIGLADLDREQANANTPFGALIVKRPRVADPGSQLVVLELWQFATLLRQQEALHKVLTPTTQHPQPQGEVNHP